MRIDRIHVLLGGRVAEELVLGEASTGAQNDLQRVTDLARSMVAQFGMSEALGSVTYEAPRAAAFLDIKLPGQREYSERTAQTIDEQVKTLLTEARARARDTLVARRAVLDALAKLLLAKETVDRVALDELLASDQSLPAGEPVRSGEPATETRRQVPATVAVKWEPRT